MYICAKILTLDILVVLTMSQQANINKIADCYQCEGFSFSRPPCQDGGQLLLRLKSHVLCGSRGHDIIYWTGLHVCRRGCDVASIHKVAAKS